MTGLASRVKMQVERWFNCTIYRGWYPRGNSLAFDRTRILGEHPSVIFDVGANLGDTVTSLAKQYPQSRIFAFEPVSTTFKHLQSRVAEFSNVSCHQLALGAEPSSAEINIYSGHCNNSLLDVRGEQRVSTEQVSVTTINDFCRQHEIAHIDYLKIDTEGFDLEVMRGATSLLAENRIRSVLAELGFSKHNKKHVTYAEFQDFMHRHAMGIFGIYDQRREFDGSHLLRRADCLFISDGGQFDGLDDCPDY